MSFKSIVNELMDDDGQRPITKAHLGLELSSNPILSERRPKKMYIFKLNINTQPNTRCRQLYSIHFESNNVIL